MLQRSKTPGQHSPRTKQSHTVSVYVTACGKPRYESMGFRFLWGKPYHRRFQKHWQRFKMGADFQAFWIYCDTLNKADLVECAIVLDQRSGHDAWASEL